VSVDLKSVIDEAVGNMTAQISEKNIALRVEVPENLPPVRANKDALQQILENLLQNACLVTPADGEIRLFAKVEQQDNEFKFIHISMTDQGGGIEKADLPRVFSRRYKMENPIIKGIGDSGVGLSIVKSLVELHKGRVWVDTKVGDGSTFSVLLPMAEDQTSLRNPIISTS
jgi:signal transduction histidine kinase